MELNNKQIAIVGGGPGGLTLARLLQLKGANVNVYERDFDKNARVQGAPLDLHEDAGLAALRKAELLDAFKKNFLRGADKKVITNAHAEILFSDHDAKPEENFGADYFRPEIDRGPLRNLLLTSLKPETVVWNSHFISMETEGEGWRLHFKNGISVYADIVIAADGANSKIRPYITEIKPFYSGIVMLEGNIHKAKETTPAMAALFNGGKVMAFGNGKCILGGQKGNGDLGFYASFKADEQWPQNCGLDYNDTSRMLDWFKKEYPGWSAIWNELFENAVPPFIPRPIYCMPLNQHWETKTNLTMLGDAAHVMPPFAGEGVNMAMRDALELSECLTSGKFSTLQAALSFYEANMRKRASKAARESLQNGETMHSEHALEKMLAFFSGHR